MAKANLQLVVIGARRFLADAARVAGEARQRAEQAADWSRGRRSHADALIEQGQARLERGRERRAEHPGCPPKIPV